METSLSNTAIFQSIGNVVEKSFVRQASLNEKFIELQAIIASLIVISIMYQGYLTMATDVFLIILLTSFIDFVCGNLTN